MMRFAKVAIAIPKDQPFDYIIPKSLIDRVKVGCRVVVPFRNKRLIGYVLGLSNRTKAKNLRPVLRLIDSKPLLDRKFLSLTREVSNYYCCTQAEAIETALPLAIRKGRTVEVTSSQTKTRPLPSRLQRAPSVVSSQRGEFEVVLIHDKDGNKRFDFYFEEIEKTLNSNRSVIFLCPEVQQVLKMKDLLGNRFKQKIVIIHRRLSQKEELQNWREIREVENLICIGTRSAVFAPVSDLGLIILDCEEDESFKQDQKPFYHAHKIAIMRAKREKIKVILGSITPSLESYFLTQKRKYSLINLEREFNLPKVNLIDMRSELVNRKKRVILSKFLEAKINQSITEKEKILIFLNRRGFATYNYCKMCGFVLRCPRCNTSLTYIFEKKRLICNYCQYSSEIPDLCPNCNSSYMCFRGLGLEKLESQFHLFFPQAKILRLERAYRPDLYDTDILISTREILKGELAGKFDLLGIVLADQSLNLLDFRAAEKTFQLFYKLLLLCKKNFIIQSFNPNHYSLVSISKGDYTEFYREELKQRRLLNFPPFRNLIKINLRGEKEDSLIRISDSLFKKIKKNIKDRDTEIFSPLPDIPSKLRGKFRYRIIMKTKNVQKLSLSLKRILRNFSHSKIVITVDVDPL